jgi:hypothetical protein
MASEEAQKEGGNATNEESNTNDKAEAEATGNCNSKSSGNEADQSKNIEDHSHIHDRPIVCILEDPPFRATSSSSSQRCRMFRVIRSKGKALASGGFGVTIATGSSTGGDNEEQEDDDSEDSEHEDTPVVRSGALDADNNHISNKRTINNDVQSKEKTDTQPSATSKTKTTKSAEYLFIEEVLFLHEKGLLRALLSSKLTKEAKDRVDTDVAKPTIATNTNNNGNTDTDADAYGPKSTPLDTSQLYQLLPSLGIGLAVYRVYSHLRSQDFRVLRHDPDRYDILCRQNDDIEERRQRNIHRKRKQKQQEQQREAAAELLKKDEPLDGGSSALPEDSLPHRTNNPRKISLSLRRMVRESIQNAPPPSIPHPNHRSSNDSSNDANANANTIGICWDAYNPNSNFGKTHPGLPDFYVTATYYNIPAVLFSNMKTLLRDKCKGIPLKVATVSDSGT